ncbi:uncharacterized protein BDV14DRAFT_185974 [Aspergillus stella-maris]|uniref:uncharacterized protein n=1 Tax=Aspergillus stella-maris TaxID=1810926 RepID=UPI003CCDFEBD
MRQARYIRLTMSRQARSTNEEERIGSSSSDRLTVATTRTGISDLKVIPTLGITSNKQIRSTGFNLSCLSLWSENRIR